MGINWFFTIIIGLILGIPFSIFANIYTPKITQFIEKRKKTISEKRKIAIKNDLEEVEYYDKNTNAFTNLAVTASLKVTFAAQIFSIITVVLFGIPQTFQLLKLVFPYSYLRKIEYINQIFYLLSSILNLFLAVYLIQIVKKPIELYKKISNLKEFKEEMNELLTKNE